MRQEGRGERKYEHASFVEAPPSTGSQKMQSGLLSFWKEGLLTCSLLELEVQPLLGQGPRAEGQWHSLDLASIPSPPDLLWP